MSHEFESGLMVKEKAWHGLGTVVQDAPTLAEAITLAGLNWDVETEPLFCGDGQQVSANAVRRVTDKRVLGVVGPRYTPLQNREAFDWFQPFVDSGEVSIETAGSLKNGQIVWILTKLNTEPVDIGGGDCVNKYLQLYNGHNGKLAAAVGFVPVRTVCWNTLSANFSAKSKKVLRVWHSSKVKKNLELVRDTINVANQEFEATAEQYRTLAKKQISKSDLRKYVKEILDPKTEESKLSTRMKNLISQVIAAVETSPGSELESAAGTLWGAYNGLTYHLSHTACRNEDSRYTSLWFGQNAILNAKAFDLALQLAS